VHCCSTSYSSYSCYYYVYRSSAHLICSVYESVICRIALTGVGYLHSCCCHGYAPAKRLSDVDCYDESAASVLCGGLGWLTPRLFHLYNHHPSYSIHARQCQCHCYVGMLIFSSTGYQYPVNCAEKWVRNSGSPVIGISISVNVWCHTAALLSRQSVRCLLWELPTLHHHRLV
jgi:hypothetical protein